MEWGDPRRSPATTHALKSRLRGGGGAVALKAFSFPFGEKKALKMRSGASLAKTRRSDAAANPPFKFVPPTATYSKKIAAIYRSSQFSPGTYRLMDGPSIWCRRPTPARAARWGHAPFRAGSRRPFRPSRGCRCRSPIHPWRRKGRRAGCCCCRRREVGEAVKTLLGRASSSSSPAPPLS